MIDLLFKGARTRDSFLIVMESRNAAKQRASRRASSWLTVHRRLLSPWYQSCYLACMFHFASLIALSTGVLARVRHVTLGLDWLAGGGGWPKLNDFPHLTSRLPVPPTAITPVGRDSVDD